MELLLVFALSQASLRLSWGRHYQSEEQVPSILEKLQLFFLPPYPPDLNPDELVWNHLKTNTVARSTVSDKLDFEKKISKSMICLQKNKEKIRSFFQKDNLKYAAKCRLSKELVNNVNREFGLKRFEEWNHNHTKFMVVDNQVVMAGSGNLDSQSYHVSGETNFIVDNHEIARHWCQQVFARDFIISQSAHC